MIMQDAHVLRTGGNNLYPVVRYAMRKGPTAWLRKLPIDSKILVSFGLPCLLPGLSQVAGLFEFARVDSYVDRHQRIAAGQNAVNAIYPNLSIVYYWSASGKEQMR